MMARPHQRHGWLFLAPSDWRSCLDRQIQERDKLDDITFSGPPPAWIAWVDEVQMPKLAQHAHYQRQFQDRITELELKLSGLEQQISAGRLDLEPAAGLIRKEMRWLGSLLEVAHA